MADIATQNQPFVALVASVIPFQANPSHFFAVFVSLVAITTHPIAQNSRSGRFRVDDDNNNRWTKRLLYPLLRMRPRGNNVLLNKTIRYCQGPVFNLATGSWRELIQHVMTGTIMLSISMHTLWLLHAPRPQATLRRREGLVSTVCACAEFFVYFSVKHTVYYYNSNPALRSTRN